MIEEGDIKWQEKIFSPRERKYYGDEKNCVTDLHKKYHERIIEAASSNEESRLFTYTSNDFYHLDKLILMNNNKNATTNLSTRNANALPIAKNRKPFVERYNKMAVDEWPAKWRMRENHCVYKDLMSMYVFVDPSSNDQLAARNLHFFPHESEILLCTITYDRVTKILTIDPDFTNGEDCYTVQESGLFYDYWIEDASLRPNDYDENDQRRQVLRQDIEEKRPYKNGETFPEMAMPPANILRLFVNLEIVSANGFPYDALFLTYRINLPRHWATRESERLTGRTQRCRMIEGKANFSYVSEIPLDFDLNCLNNIDVQPFWPYLFFTIGSIDSWSRYRIEGYASMPLPVSSGTHNFHLQTWRPIGRFVNILRRFFTGGTSELVDVTYCGIPDPRDSSRLDKTRLKVTPGGSITINLNIVRQSKIFTKNHQAYERLSADTINNSLDNVLEQFKAARERMVRAIAR